MGYSTVRAIAAELSVRRPDLVSRDILTEGDLMTGGGKSTPYIADIDTNDFSDTRLPGMPADLRKAPLDGDPVDDIILSRCGQIAPKTLHQMAQALVDLRPEFLSASLTLQIPCFYVFGETSRADPERVKATDLPFPDMLLAVDMTVDTMAGFGHDLILTDPSDFAARIAPMLTP